jgi:hypothetical protein
MAKFRDFPLAPFIIISALLAGCQTQPTGPCRLDLTPVTYKDLPGWKEDKALKALPAMKHSCAALLKKDPNAPILTQSDRGGTVSDWHPFCTQILDEPPQNGSCLKIGNSTPFKTLPRCLFGKQYGAIYRIR